MSRQLLGGSCLRERAGRWGGELHRTCRSRVLAAVEVKIVGQVSSECGFGVGGCYVARWVEAVKCRR